MHVSVGSLTVAVDHVEQLLREVLVRGIERYTDVLLRVRVSIDLAFQLCTEDSIHLLSLVDHGVHKRLLQDLKLGRGDGPYAV